jgi:hypothetical protein
LENVVSGAGLPSSADSSVSSSVASPAGTTGGVPSSHLSAVTDPAELFILSGMVDLLRDAVVGFVQSEVEPGRAAITQLINHYRLLLFRIPATLNEKAADDLSLWAPELPAVPTLAHLQLSLSTLARYLDVLVQAPQFATQHRILVAASDRTNRRLAEGLVVGEEEKEDKSGNLSVPPHSGMYI